ncbi:MAG: 2Fe-2S iron-sulfur cluster binding domain-containing protein [Candidatus Eremiobacteraeota bacterium]|nr:2Fe-2S iron-sulfur cluster binding domain-containing protein [Candidatus Eremiobacteraeota bacterium]
MKKIHFDPGDMECIANGKTILDVSREAGIPHTCACGGNARCSTCRVLILENPEACLPRNEKEEAIAKKLNFGPKVRLACQTRVSGDVKVRRLVLDREDEKLSNQLDAGSDIESVGREIKLAILFADIKGFTPFAEQVFPYDAIHVLNRYFNWVQPIISSNGGSIFNFMGDGLMALFGTDDEEQCAEHAVRTGVEMLEAMDEFNEYLSVAFHKHLDIRIGIHYGEAVIGAVGAGPNRRATAIGDSVNFASRIENANKKTGTRLLISEETYKKVKDIIDIGRIFRMSLAGKSGEHNLYEVVGIKRGGLMMKNNEENNSKSIEILSLLSRAEMILARLYDACAKTWREDQGFWNKLRNEEVGHSKAIDRIKKIVSKNMQAVVFDFSFSRIDINLLIESLKGLTVKVLNRELAKGVMFTIGRDLESSIIEYKYLEMLKTEDPEILKIVERIESDTRRHEEMMEKAVERERNEEIRLRRLKPIHPDIVQLDAEPDGEIEEGVSISWNMEKGPFEDDFKEILPYEIEDKIPEKSEILTPESFLEEEKELEEEKVFIESMEIVSPEDLIDPEEFAPEPSTLEKPSAKVTPSAFEEEKKPASLNERELVRILKHLEKPGEKRIQTPFKIKLLEKKKPQIKPVEPEQKKATLGIGKLFKNRFFVLKLLAKGEHGDIYLVEDSSKRKKYVLREIVASDLDMKKDELKSWSTNLSKIIGRLEEYKHINLAEILYGFNEENKVYMVMENIEGLDLESLLKIYKKPLSQKELLKFGLEISSALNYLHHNPKPYQVGEIKSDSLVLDIHGVLKLVDYNVERFSETIPTRLPGNDRDGDGKDITSLARLMFYLGNRSYYNQDADKQEWHHTVSPALREVLELACREGQDRYKDIRGFISDLNMIG